MSRKILLTQGERRAAERRRVAAVIAANARRTIDPVWRANVKAANRARANDPDSKWSKAMRRMGRSKKRRAACSRGQLIRWARVRRAAWHEARA